MIKRSYVINKLNNIQDEMNRVMLQEGPFNIFTNFFSRLGTKAGLIENTVNTLNLGSNGQKIINFSREMVWTGRTRTISGIFAAIGTWFWGRQSGFNAATSRDQYTDGAYRDVIGRDPNIDAALYTLSQNLPGNLPGNANALVSVASDKASEKEKGVFSKLWDSVSNNYKKFCDIIRKGIGSIGGTPFLVLGYGTALGLILAGTLIYYINVRGEIGASLKRVFVDTFNGIKNASGIEQIIRLMATPILLVMKFIEESPLGTMLFALGIFVFAIVSIGTIIGWNVIFGSGKDKATGKVPAANNQKPQQKQAQAGQTSAANNPGIGSSTPAITPVGSSTPNVAPVGSSTSNVGSGNASGSSKI